MVNTVSLKACTCLVYINKTFTILNYKLRCFTVTVQCAYPNDVVISITSILLPCKFYHCPAIHFSKICYNPVRLLFGIWGGMDVSICHVILRDTCIQRLKITIKSNKVMMVMPATVTDCRGISLVSWKVPNLNIVMLVMSPSSLSFCP